MSQLGLSMVLLLTLGVVATLLIHTLSTRPRRQLLVATLKPFAVPAKRRLLPVRLTQHALLASRIALFIVLAMMLVPQQTPPRVIADAERIVALLPGVDQTAIDPQVAADASVIQLAPAPTGQGSLTPELQLGAFANLLRLDQTTPEDTSITVIGDWQARELPKTLSLWSHDIRFETHTRLLNSAEGEASTPAHIVVALRDDSRAQRVIEAIQLWFEVGVLDRATTLVSRDLTEGTLADAWLITDGDLTLNTTGVNAFFDLRTIEDEASVTRSELASVLWLQLTQALLEPPPETRALPPLAARASAVSRLDVDAPQPVSEWWLVLLMCIFAVERFLAIPRGAA